MSNKGFDENVHCLEEGMRMGFMFPAAPLSVSKPISCTCSHVFK